MKNYRTLHALLSAFLAVILLVSSFSVGVTAIGNSDWNPNDWNWDEHDGWWQLSDAADGAKQLTTTGELVQLYYKNSIENMNSVGGDITVNRKFWDGAGNNGIGLTSDQGKNYFCYVDLNHQTINIAMNDAPVASENLEKSLSVGQEYRLELQWDDTSVTLCVEGEPLVSYNYKSNGDTFEKSAKVWFSEWGNAMTLKNLSVEQKKSDGGENRDWSSNGWNSSMEGGIVWTATGTENNGFWPTLTYTGLTEDFNSVSYELRHGGWNWIEGWVGLVLTSGSNEYVVDYRPDANSVRIRRNGEYVAYTSLNFHPTAEQWASWQIMWNSRKLYVKVKDTVLLEYDYAAQGDKLSDSTPKVKMMSWGCPSGLRNPVVSTVGPESWNYIDLEFKDALAVQAFTVTGGTASYVDGTMVVDITSENTVVQSPHIDVSAGTPYSAFLPVRNTLVVRLKNDTAADQIKLYFVSTRNSEYGEKCSKTFAIEPNSGWKTYFFNLSDVIYMGAAAKPYKFTADILNDCEGYLRGFRLEMPAGVSSGSFAIDAITFERETELYDYLGEITSCIGNKDEKKITVTGKVDSSRAGQTVTIYESAVNNYNESMSYPMNTEHRTEMTPIEKLAETKVRSDGTFSVDIPLYSGEVSRLSSLFLAWIGDRKVSGHFSIDNYTDFYKVDRFKVPDFSVKVTDAQFGAKGDAFTDDTKAIQAAIDYVAAQGGGVVILPGDTEHWYGRRYIATNINLRSNIELRVEKGAMIWQSQRVEEYDYSSNSFLDAPVFGHDNDREGVVWAHAINDNLPLVYVGGGYDEATGKWGEAIRNVRITGGGIIRMMDTGGEQPDPHNYGWNSNILVGCNSRMHIASMVFWNAESCDLVNMRIQRTNSWHVTTHSASDMYFANNTLEQAACINSDSFGCNNSKNVTIFRNFVYGNDDAVTFTVTAEDKRAHVFYFIDKDRDNSVENFKIISNQLWNGLGITFIPWGSGGEDLSRYLIKNILVYDNVLGGESCAIGSWPDNPTYGWSSYYNYNLDKGETDDWSPIQDVYILNNTLRKPYNVRVAQISNLIIENTTYKGEKIGYINSQVATQFIHGNFDRMIRSTVDANGFKDESEWTAGLSNWSYSNGANGNVGTEKVRSDLKYSGYIRGDGEMWQGLYTRAGSHALKIKVKAISGEATVFVADRYGKVLTEKRITGSSEFEEIVLPFIAPESQVYRLGVKHTGGADEVVYLDDAAMQDAFFEADVPPDAKRVIYPFTDATELKDFRLLNSTGKGGFTVADGRLISEIGEGEYKALLKGANRKIHTLSVDIYPGASGAINGGVYIGAGGGRNPQNSINALGILVESNFEGWADAPNRIDLVFGSFPDWKELYRFTSESANGNALYAGGEKEPLKLEVAISGKMIVATLSLLEDPSVYTQTIYTYTGDADLQLGMVGLRTLDNDCQYDNLELTYTEVTDADRDNSPEKTETVDFDDSGSADRFDFYTSSAGGFLVQNGKLVPAGEAGEFKAIYKDDGRKKCFVSVDILPDASRKIDAGLYIGVSTVAHGVDMIKGLGILVESGFEGWDDAVNRIDLVVGQFPIWKELHRYTSETGNGNALFAGSKEAVNLRVDIDGNIVTVTLSLLSDPDIFVKTIYEYTGTETLSLGKVGIRSHFNDATFDNFCVGYAEEKNGSAKEQSPATGDSVSLTQAFSILLGALVCLLCVLPIKKKNRSKKN